MLEEVPATTGWVTLNWPESRNALTFAMYDRLAEICSTRIPQMNCQIGDLPWLFCYKNQCNTIIETDQVRLTRWVTPECLNCASISTGA